MRILVLTNLYPPHYLGGYELICEAVTNALKTRGHEVSILASNHVRAGVPENGEQAIERSLRIHGLYGHPWLGIASLWKLERHNNLVLRDAIKQTKPDLVYVWNMGGLSKSLLFTLESLGIPVAFYVSDHWIARGSEADVWSQWWNRSQGSKKQLVLRSLLALSGIKAFVSRTAANQPLYDFPFRRVYFCSNALRDLTVSAGYRVQDASIIYCPVDVEKFQGVVRGQSESLRRFLWVGRLAPDKGVMTALRALSFVGEKCNARLDVYGSGEPDYVAGLRHFVADKKLPVQFCSAPASEMPEIYRNHDALLFTSEWAEPFALTPLEAMASGLPVIGTMTGGSPEIFRHEQNALTYAAGNAEELAARIVQLSNDAALREKIAMTGQSEVRKRFSEPVIVDQIEKFLIETLGGWPKLKSQRAGHARSLPETKGSLELPSISRSFNNSSAVTNSTP
jgi:glycogen(starch) synthase